MKFSLEGYRELLLAFKGAGYSFCGFEEIGSRLREGHPFVVLRHDMDISLRPAVEIARIEYEEEVQATYFILLRSPFYNALSRDNAKLIRRIHHYGHEIATHLDLVAYDDDLARALKEVEIFSALYPFINPRLVSLHSSTTDLQHMPIASAPQLDTVYGPAIRGETAYISDSTGRWRFGHPLDSEAFEMRKPIQLLTHPIWWIQEGEIPAQKLNRWLYADYQHNCATLREFMPKMFRRDEL
jgi:hypothetical protein